MGKVISLCLLCVLSAPVTAQSARVGESPKLWEYYSAFWLNLHHTLYEHARAQLGLDANRTATLDVRADTIGLSSLSAADRAAWDDAVSYYARRIAPTELLDRNMASLKEAIGDAGNSPVLSSSRIDDSLRLVLNRVAPVYRSLWWKRDDARNREWVARMQPEVAAHGAKIAAAAARAFNIPWSDFLIRVDASAYSSWAGAYTTVYPDRITVSTRDSLLSGGTGLETLIHESLHTLVDSVDAALRSAAVRQGRRVPPDFIHAMIFFTAGELTRRELGRDYVTYAGRVGIWNRGAYPAYLPVLRDYWTPWLEGRTTFQAAIDAMVAQVSP